MVVYSTAFKANIVRQLASPGGPSASALSKEVGVCQPTLSRWLREAGDRVTAMKKPTNKRPRDWSPEEKMAAVVDASSVSEEQLGAFLRRKGLHQAQLDQWREAMVLALGGEHKRKAISSAQARRLRELEKELRRKDKALAEAAALLVLKKKAREIWGDEADGTEPRSGR